MMTMDQLNRIGDFLRMLRSRLNVELAARHALQDQQDLRELIAELQTAIFALNSVHVETLTEFEPKRGLFVFPIARLRRYTVDIAESSLIVVCDTHRENAG